MGPTEQQVALISHGRKILEVYKDKGIVNGYLERPDSARNLPLEGSKHELWAAATAKLIQSAQLLVAIERNALKLAEHIANADKSSIMSNLSQLTAPLAMGPPVEIELDEHVVWLAQQDVSNLVDAKTKPLQDDLARANATIEELNVKVQAYKVQLQSGAPIVERTSPMALQKRLERHIQEKDELIRALRETLDDVANDSSRMEKLLVTQSDAIAILQHEKQQWMTADETKVEVAAPAQVMSPPTSETQDLVPADDGRTHRVEDFETPLPPGWEMRVTNIGDVYFIHKHSKVTTWVDPRQHPIQLQSSLATPVTTQYTIEFHDKRPIGVLFQPNAPVDQGACVRRVLEDTPAEYAAQILPGHQLVAVNGHRVQEASFRHIMLLLQGGYRPLTLTFDRLVREGTVLETTGGGSPDEDNDNVDEPEGYSLADQLITGVFSLVWAAPDDTLSAQVQPI
ncbi:hypothetical protein ACHHYP_07337 [Achlya hypogyna]|uniref:WW domain-containing protein n=1 Tax=Achlya hypogyna TaxID=1202772 RepID=A0A1V9ZLV1_ACHHY|nr:hypothetical protein ACHHYP_07337 [Achlya hypogyna]